MEIIRCSRSCVQIFLVPSRRTWKARMCCFEFLRIHPTSCTPRWKITTRNLLLPVYWMCFMTLEWSHPLSWYKLAYRSGFYVTLQKQLTNERNETLTRAWNVGKGKFTLLQSSKYLSKHHCKNSNCIDLVWTLHSQIKLDKRAGPHYWNHSKELMCINTAGT